MTITLLHDGGMPALTTDIIRGTVPDGDAKEDVIIDPSGDGANPLSPKNVQGGIADLAINAPGRRKAEIVADVDGELVLADQLDDQAWPLV
jgi:hypothetical protein